MLEGTKRLFPTDYQRFKENMIEAANDNSLPVTLQMDDALSAPLLDLIEIEKIVPELKDEVLKKLQEAESCMSLL